MPDDDPENCVQKPSRQIARGLDRRSFWMCFVSASNTIDRIATTLCWKTANAAESEASSKANEVAKKPEEKPTYPTTSNGDRLPPYLTSELILKERSREKTRTRDQRRELVPRNFCISRYSTGSVLCEIASKKDPGRLPEDSINEVSLVLALRAIS